MSCKVSSIGWEFGSKVLRVLRCFTGKQIVLWRDSEQQWRCFEDVCPHRYSSFLKKGSLLFSSRFMPSNTLTYYLAILQRLF